MYAKTFIFLSSDQFVGLLMEMVDHSGSLRQEKGDNETAKRKMNTIAWSQSKAFVREGEAHHLYHVTQRR